MYFILVKPAMETRDANMKTRDDTIANGGTQDNVRIKNDDLLLAQQEVAQAQSLMDKYMREKMPNISLQDRRIGMLALWHEQSEVLGPLLIKWINNSGVRLSSSISIQAPPANPNAITYDAVTPIKIDLGRISVTGTFKQIMKHIRMWNSCNRLVLIDLPTLSGESPNITCEYSLSVFIFPRTASGDLVQMAGDGGTTSGMGGPSMGGGLPQAGGLPMPGSLPKAPGSN